MSLGKGSFKNEALKNDDKSTKHPNLENGVPKTQKQSTQILKPLYFEGQQLLKVLHDASQTRWTQWMHPHLQRSTTPSLGAFDFSPAEVERY